MEIKERIVSVIFALLLCAMVYSSFIQSMCMMALVMLGFLNFETTPNGTKISWTWRPFSRLLEFSKYSHFLVITLYFFIVLFSFWQVEGDNSYWLERLRIKVPFLLIPLAYLGLPKLNKGSFCRILYYFIAMMAISVIGVLALYFTRFEEVNLMLKQGQHLATPCNHIRFSQLVALAVLAGWYLIKQRYSQGVGSHNVIIKVLTVALFIAIHILSVKTGIVALYTALFILALRHIYTTRKFAIGIAVLATLIILPLVAYKTIPSFSEKAHYTIYDFQMYNEGQGDKYGDSGRLTSLKVGMDIFIKSPVLGVGAGNLRSEVVSKFKSSYPEYSKPLMPHNQFLFVLAGSGVVGGILFLVAFLFPLFYGGAFRNDFYLGFYTLFFVSFMVEHTIENALGVGMFSSMILLCLLYIHNGFISNSQRNT